APVRPPSTDRQQFQAGDGEAEFLGDLGAGGVLVPGVVVEHMPRDRRDTGRERRPFEHQPAAVLVAEENADAGVITYLHDLSLLFGGGVPPTPAAGTPAMGSE